ncbi:MAG: D-aminoacyl-tRNA deacylase [Phycisphaerae bacterium]
MRAVVQRVGRASVTIAGEVIARIDAGVLVYLGVARDDHEEDATYLANKIRHLRVFRDAEGKMNLDVAEAGGCVLVVSNFTLLGDARKGRRPAYTAAAEPAAANTLYEVFCERLRQAGLTVRTGRFRESMLVQAVNDGPINILLDSGKRF